MEGFRNKKPEENMTAMSNVNQFDNQPESRHECSICISWLEEPVLTSCGHRFCKKCIESWMRQKNFCPIDNTELKNEDIFPDNFTRREILQLRCTCPYASSGCKALLAPLELEAHSGGCRYRRTISHEPSIELTIRSCPFRDVGCGSTFSDERQLAAHMEMFMQNHMQLLLAAYSGIRIDRDLSTSSISENEAMCLWDPDKSTEEASVSQSSRNSNGHTMPVKALIRTLYERLIMLEQKNREQDITIKNLSYLTNTLNQEHKTLTEDISMKHCMGNYIWKITNFHQKLDNMLRDPEEKLYSQGFYTSPDGYKFCIRINSSAKNNRYLSLNVHMMPSDNDDFLEWPFSGKILITLLNPSDSMQTLKDSLVSRPDLGAFQKPQSNMTMKSYGFTEYVLAEDIRHNGFIKSDTVIVKIKVTLANP